MNTFTETSHCSLQIHTGIVHQTRNKKEEKIHIFTVTHPYPLHWPVHDGIFETVPSTSIRDETCFALLFLFVNTGFNALT